MHRCVFLGLAALLAFSTGCRREVGECNLMPTPEVSGPAALDLAYDINDGLPMYEGQAIVQQSCGNGAFCHAPAAVGGDRFGVPAGLDFDVSLACNESVGGCDSTTCETNPDSGICAAYTRLDANANQIFELAGLTIGQIRSGAMPPGGAGRVVRGGQTFQRAFLIGNTDDDEPLPGIDTSEGEEIVRNWLACGAPVVGRTEASTPSSQLTTCTSVGDEACIRRGPSTLPDPMWSSIYERLIIPQCLSCHGPANGNTDANPDNPLSDSSIPGGASPEGLAALDLSGVDLMNTTNWASDSYAAVVGAAASAGSDCAGQGTLVVPNDAANSLFVQKISATQTCGDVMPPNLQQTQQISDAVIAVVEMWISAGAPNN